MSNEPTGPTSHHDQEKQAAAVRKRKGKRHGKIQWAARR
jgi:hypothetical protein